MESKTFLTRKELMKATGATAEQIVYLRLRGRLPMLNEPDKGIPAKYKPECVEIIRAWMEKKNYQAGY
jgi:hypothetical protein